MALSNLTVRLATAAVVVPLLLLLLFAAPPWGWALLLLVASGIGALELFGMTHPGDRVSQTIGALTTMAVAAAFYLYSDQPRLMIGVAALYPILMLLLPLWRLGEIPSAGLRLMGSVANPLYIALPLVTLALLRRDTGDDGPGYVLLVLFFAWWGDTGAYFAGRRFGRAKLYPAVSPNKTRAGFVGAMLGAVCGGLVAHFLFLPSFSLHAAFWLAPLCGALGQLGDLVESLLKRSTGIKDSGQIVPGHGGLLDRIDALLFVSPAVYVYVLL